MKRLRVWILRIAGLLPSARRETGLANELEAHLQLHIDDNLRQGMTLQQARRDAALKLGGVEAVKQVYRDTSTVPFVENLLQDVGFAARQLRKSPGFSFTAIFMLSLGMCASVSIFAFVDTALIKPLPYHDPRQLVRAFETTPECPQCVVSYFDFQDWKKQNTVFRSVDGLRWANLSLKTTTGVESALGFRVSDGFFRTLGITPVLGRDFYPGEDLPSATRTVLLSYSAWQQRYGGKPDALGHNVTLSGDEYTIIGVLPRDFQVYSTSTEFWVPLNAPAGSCEARRACHSIAVIGRLKDGVSISAASADVKLLTEQLGKQYPDSNRGQGAELTPLAEDLVGNIRSILWMLLSGAGLLLLIATVNVASLLLVRSESRRREIAVRGALGASRARIIRQFCTEGLVLVAASAGLGLLLAYWTMQLLSTLIPAKMATGMPFLIGIGLNGRVLVFAAVVALLAALLFAIAPTLQLSSMEVRSGLAEGSRGSAGTGWRRLGSKLVMLELATAVVLLVGAGLLGKSLMNLLHVDLGLQPDHVATLQFAAPASFENDKQVMAMHRKVLAQVAALPGVKSSAISSDLPVNSWDGGTWIRIWGKPLRKQHNDVPEREVSSGYFAAIGAKFWRGRNFTAAEDASKPDIVIINRTFASLYYPGEDPIGKQISYENAAPQPLQIVGIVEDIKEGQMDTTNRATMYVPLQHYGSYYNLVVRTSQEEHAILPQLVSFLHRIDPEIATKEPATLPDLIGNSRAAYLHRSAAWLVGGFASLALLLSVVGLYGVVAYSVSQRTREIGVRMALGADRSSVYHLILKEAARLTGVGLAAGLAGAILAAALMRGLLFGVSSWDVPTLGAVALVLGIAALLASYIPARRAASVNPLDALRAE